MNSITSVLTWSVCISCEGYKLKPNIYSIISNSVTMNSEEDPSGQYQLALVKRPSLVFGDGPAGLMFPCDATRGLVFQRQDGGCRVVAAARSRLWQVVELIGEGGSRPTLSKPHPWPSTWEECLSITDRSLQSSLLHMTICPSTANNPFKYIKVI